jgi:hypothetical protein
MRDFQMRNVDNSRAQLWWARELRAPHGGHAR